MSERIEFNLFHITDDNRISYEIERHSDKMTNVFTGFLPVQDVRCLIDAFDMDQYMCIENSCEYDPDYGISFYTDNGYNYATILFTKDNNKMEDRVSKYIEKLRNFINKTHNGT